jgi:hypothetical protein
MPRVNRRARMYYNYKIGIIKQRMISIKKRVMGIMATGAMVGAMAVPALAAGNSTPGLDRYLDNPGRQQATAVGAQCGSGAGSGAFGYLGKDASMAGGADGQQTGENNSAVCGNRP